MTLIEFELNYALYKKFQPAKQMPARKFGNLKKIQKSVTVIKVSEATTTGAKTIS